MFEEAIGKKLLIIGAEPSIVNIVNQAKEMGVYTIVTERGHDYTKLPAKIAADEAWDIDYSDIITLSEKCCEAGVQGVMSGYSEGKVLCAAKLSELIGTSFYVTSEQVEITRNKKTFKNLCEQHGVPIPKEYCLNGSMTNQEKETIRYPVIVKPADYGGRIGITVCYSREDLDSAIEIAGNSSVTQSIVVEEYLSGTELTAIYTIVDGQTSLSIVNDKYLSREGNKYKCLCDVAITPSKYYKKYLETIDSQIRELLMSLAVKNGVAGFQFIATDNKIYAFEMGLRLNAGNDWKLLSTVNGINHMKMLINYSLTGSMGDSLSKDNPNFDKYMATYVMYVHGGEVGFINFRAIEGHEGIVDINSYVYVGKIIPDKGTTQQRAISFKIIASTITEMAKTIKYIQEHIIVEDVNGSNMLFESFSTARFEH